MPELPEVEIVRQSLDKKIKQKRVKKVIIRNRNLRFLIPNNFRMVGIELVNNNLFSGITFAADVLYFNKNYFKV